MNAQDRRFYFAPDSDEGILYQKLYLLGFGSERFKKRWEDFESKHADSLENSHIRHSIREVMTFFNPVTQQSYYNIPTWTYIYNKGHKFYRVRKINSKEISIPPKETACWEDIWNPPDKYVKDYGRLNYPSESLLYTAADNPNIAISELKLKENDSFLLITYEAIEDIFVTIVGFHQDHDYLTDTENEKFKILTSFFRDIFSKEVAEHNKYLYKISSNLIKECYTINDDSQDGWLYPSIANKKGNNVCFKPTIAKQKLSVSGVELCKAEKSHGFLINYVLDDIDEHSDFSYHLIGSEVQLRKYPHIKHIEQE